MDVVVIVLLVVAAVLLLLAAVGIHPPRVSLLAAGLAVFVLAFLIPDIAAVT
jgi:hypothetical protein